ncbi:MAG TPA: hypothetical protein ENJ84_15590 [Gammaproteobacteria bacterium]|nr:hypothetical protein [Gammaproteobacteria bacterium]
MEKQPLRKFGVMLLVVLLAVLSGCSSKQDEWQQMLQEASSRADRAVSNLEKQISNGGIRNTRLLSRYADVVRKQKPEMGEIVDALAEDATLKGPILKGLKSRLETARQDAKSAPAQGQAAVENTWNELNRITSAAAPDVYGMMLTDPINVLADMSDGRLARVSAMSKEASALANQSGDQGVGGQLVGNPNYGHWQQDSSGNSFWAWYGQYALLSSLFRGPVSYGGWAGRRDYSYYNDYGRDAYTSPSQRREQNTVRQQTEKKFKREGKTFRSPYAKTRTGGASGIKKPVIRNNRSFKSASKKSSGSFKSPYKSSSKSSTLSSSRSSSYRTSRSFGGGK